MNSRERSMAARMSRAHDLDKTNGRLDGGAHSERAQLAGAPSVGAPDTSIRLELAVFELILITGTLPHA